MMHPTRVLAGTIFLVVGGGCASTPKCVVAPGGMSLIELRTVHATSEPHLQSLDFQGKMISVQPEPILTDRDLRNVETRIEAGRLAVMLDVDPAAALRLSKTTAAHVGQRLGVIIHGQLRALLPIRGAIGSPGQPLYLFIEMPTADARAAAAAIQQRWCGGQAGFEDYIG